MSQESAGAGGSMKSSIVPLVAACVAVIAACISVVCAIVVVCAVAFSRLNPAAPDLAGKQPPKDLAADPAGPPGALDPGFGSTGRATTDFGSAEDFACAAA